MRGSFYTFAILACLLALVAAWSKEDQEIFRLQNEVATHDGDEVTFYDLLDIKSSASQEEIRAAYKKKSRTQHPDKVKAQFIADKSTGKDEKSKNKKPGVKVSKGPSQAEIKAHYQQASDRFTRLGLINKILLGEGRARYDHFLKNGFPKWKGTGYYYARFRPGFGSVLVGLFIFVGGGGHYLALYLSWKRQREFVERYISFARNAAWGGNANLNVPGLDGTSTPGTDTDADADLMAQPMNRKQRRMQEKDAKKDKSDKKVKKVKASAPGTPTTITGPKKRVVAENGKVLIVDSSNNVYLEQPDEDGKMREYLLDLDELPAPTMRETALFRLPTFTFNQTIGRFLNKTPVEEEHEETEEVSSSSGADDFEVLEKVKTTATNGNGKATRRNKKNGR
ncbi:hypothetical protein SS1G_04154 [Sclerotinia sclerotiorum 1980 UF-70]|uniref:J domain-containing protein n=2 Tax=Sclerotinia sclerotiorum (strain ATCC 18683 / 1980 / Ss-1) TaxID=665079 RepID=A7EFR3_SCLS1|nr:hypothetical protein SS1G_04154 [Sclerotinia sclerotiorum 1980 UF-70]APA07131.1 hypothetical protein sscle_02g019010 [Sclerotinia sclerotiorum 1980 UF-70]EDO01679.1 hypothetical protein SS1G_04154 [Sclerotinia sclerotiorum 1980 UF-70]